MKKGQEDHKYNPGSSIILEKNDCAGERKRYLFFFSFPEKKGT